MIVLAGINGDYPPTSEEGFLAFARSLPDSTIADAIEAAEPLSPIWGYRDLANHFRHFEHLRSLPAGLIITGDAVCSFNPIYGQGMMAAAQAAEILRQCLQAQSAASNTFPSFFQRKLAKSQQAIWQLATASDYRAPYTKGPKPSAVERFSFRYTDRILPLLATDRDVFRTFLSVVHFTQPASVLMHPTLLAKVLFGQRQVHQHMG